MAALVSQAIPAMAAYQGRDRRTEAFGDGGHAGTAGRKTRAQRIEPIRRLQSSETYREDVERKTIDEHHPRADSMERFLTELDARYGGVRAYLESAGFGCDEWSTCGRKPRD